MQDSGDFLDFKRKNQIFARKKKLTRKYGPSMVAQACNLRTWKAVAGGLP